jgi:predicted RNA-binding protein (virulence factor B family)
MPIRFAKKQTLEVFERYEFGLMLRDTQDDEDVLLPSSELKNKNIRIGDKVDVFIYADRAQKLAATLRLPVAYPGEIVALEIAELNLGGNWLDWGLHFDLRLPDGEVTTELYEGDKILVKIISDPVNFTFFATNHLDPYLEPCEDLNRGDKVEAKFYRETPMGFSVVVEDKYLGLIHKSNLFGYHEIGDVREVWVDKVREDGKLDLLLKAPGFDASTDDLQERVLAKLRDFGGKTTVGDKSEPGLIADSFEMSKKSFKKTMGNLLREGLIEKHETGYKLK